ncbi:hypothetical protein [Intrasporangium sp.]|uniref:hypothetical protein n=1 Tax=Intrasporangium sp. TaxID=1925024 RepID=UPI00293ABBE1|nr:hypothetical protein [Intrasporangium sp.]MDV3220352.1 hypothetical protein [Intrasporangium sp.]
MRTGIDDAPLTRSTTAVARLLSSWPRWTAWGALIWSAAYAVAGLLWWRGADWYPFAAVPMDRMSMSILEGAPAEVVGPGFAVLGGLGVAAATVFLVGTQSFIVRRAALVVGASSAVLATTLIPDYTMLGLLALWPVLLVFAFTGVPGDQDGLGDILYWHRVNLLLVFLGGLLWAAATLAAHRRSAGRCVHCGRRPGAAQPVSVLRRRHLLVRGRRWVLLAVLATIPYDVTRLAWWLGWPLGLTEELFVSLQDPPELLTVGLALAVLSTGGAALTHGLVARWGEVFPRWIPRLRGRRVPVLLAVIPATTVTLTLPPAALMFASSRVNGGFDLANWGVWLPSLVWLLWAIGLGGATWAYHQRRRGACAHCGPHPR